MFVATAKEEGEVITVVKMNSAQIIEGTLTKLGEPIAEVQAEIVLTAEVVKVQPMVIQNVRHDSVKPVVGEVMTRGTGTAQIFLTRWTGKSCV